VVDVLVERWWAFSWRFVLLSLSLCVAPASALEQLVVTGTRQAIPSSEVVGNIATVSNDTVALVAPVYGQQVLARVPGANLTQGNGQEYLPALRSPVLTGAGGCGSFLMAVDGVPLRSAGFCNINELFEANIELAGRIEVVRGPGGVTYGSNALHGVINVISPSVDQAGKKSVSFEAGPHDYGRTTGSVSHWSGQHGLRADMVLSHDNSFRDASGFDQQRVVLRHEYSKQQESGLNVVSSLAYNNLNQETASYLTGVDAYKDRARRKDNQNPEAYRNARSVRYMTQLHYVLDDQRQLLITPYARYAEMDFLMHFLPGSPLEENQQWSVGVQSAYQWQWLDEADLSVGIDLEYTEGELLQRQLNATQGPAFLQATIPVGKHYDYQVDAITAAPFIQANWTVTHRASLMVGLRYDVMDYRYDNRMLDGRSREDGSLCGFGGCRYNRPADQDDRFENLSTRLGWLYKLTDEQQFYINLAKGFRAPQATELYRLQRDQQVADLDSESLLSLEAGIRAQYQRWEYELLFYVMRKEDVIFRDVNFFTVSDGKTKHKGVELSLRYRFSEQWDINWVANYAEHQYDGNWAGGFTHNNFVDSAPRQFGAVYLAWTPSEKGRVEVEWLYQGGYYTDPQNEHRYEGHDVLNLRARWQLNKSWLLGSRITNLSNTRYAKRADYTNFSGDRYFPGESRAVYVDATFSW